MIIGPGVCQDQSRQINDLPGGRGFGEGQVAERFMRTLKEQCIYLHQFASLEEALRLIGEFIARYNAEWLIERLGHRTPAQARAEAEALARVA